MGLFDLFTRKVHCPWCGNTGARKGLFGSPKCPNRNCNFFDADLVHEHEQTQREEENEAAVAAGKARRYRNPRTGEAIYKNVTNAGFDPGAFRIEVQYRNFRDEQKTFVGDWRTLHRRGKHISLQVVPTGIRIALAVDRMQNAAEVEAALNRCPMPQDRRVLNFHTRRGTTSPLCEQLRRKYPDWSAEQGPAGSDRGQEPND